MLFPIPSTQDETVPNGEAELGKQTCGSWAIQNCEPVSSEGGRGAAPESTVMLNHLSSHCLHHPKEEFTIA